MLNAESDEPVSLVIGDKANARSSAVASVWDLAGCLPNASLMLVKTKRNSWAAAGSALVEGGAGLNVGLLMPFLRSLPGLSERSQIGPVFTDSLHRALWGLAKRLARVEAPRTFAVNAGEVLHIGASRSGFSLKAGTSTKSLRAAVAKAVSGGLAPRYSLVSEPVDFAETVHPPTSLLTDAYQEEGFLIDTSAWPVQLPAKVSINVVGAVMAIVQRLQAAELEIGDRLQILSASARPLLTFTRQEKGWSVQNALPGV